MLSAEDTASRLKMVQDGLSLQPDRVLAKYLGTDVRALIKFRAEPTASPLPEEVAAALSVAWRYVKVSNVVLGLLPNGIAVACRGWEAQRARKLAEQRALSRLAREQVKRSQQR